MAGWGWEWEPGWWGWACDASVAWWGVAWSEGGSGCLSETVGTALRLGAGGAYGYRELGPDGPAPSQLGLGDLWHLGAGR